MFCSSQEGNLRQKITLSRQGCDAKAGGGLYLVELTNCDVMRCLKDNLDHPKYHEKWALVQRLLVRGVSSGEVRQLIADHYPAAEGFKLLTVTHMAAPTSTS